MNEVAKNDVDIPKSSTLSPSASTFEPCSRRVAARHRASFVCVGLRVPVGAGQTQAQVLSPPKLTFQPCLHRATKQSPISLFQAHLPALRSQGKPCRFAPGLAFRPSSPAFTGMCDGTSHERAVRLFDPSSRSLIERAIKPSTLFAQGDLFTEVAVVGGLPSTPVCSGRPPLESLCPFPVALRSHGNLSPFC